MMFLANMLSKMKHGTPLGSRIAEVHNGSSLFTGDAGQGESNIRRWIIENDWLEAIVALPLNMFYNTGIATYIWVLSNRKPEHRRGQCAAHRRHAVVPAAAQEPGQQELRVIRRGHPAHLRRLPGLRGDGAVEDIPQRGFRLLEGHRGAPVAAHRRSIAGAIASASDDACRDAKEEPLASVIDRVVTVLGAGPHPDFNRFMEVVMADASAHGVKLTAKRKNLLRMVLASREEAAAPVIKKTHKPGAVEPDPIRGLIEAALDGQSTVVEYEPHTDLRDTEQVPLLEEGGIDAFLRREVLPYAPDAWYVPDRASRSVTRSASLATSTNLSPCDPWRRYGLTSSPWSGRCRGCLGRLWKRLA